MAKKFQDKLYVKEELSLTEKQLDRIVKKMKERHPLENWFFVRKALNGEETTYFNRQFVRWIKEVYLNKSNDYLTLEIQFFEKEIKLICEEQNIIYEPMKYIDMSVKDLANYFKRNSDSIRTAIWKMPTELKDNCKYINDNTLYIKAEGVKWIHQNFYRKSYLEYLEKTKLLLEGVKVD